MTEENRHETAHASHYEIRVKGQLDRRWSARFDGIRVEARGDGTTAIVATDIDQAALHGLLQRVRDLGLALISVTRAPESPPDTTEHEHDTGELK